MIHADPRQVVEELFKRERDMPLAPDGYRPVPNAPKVSPPRRQSEAAAPRGALADGVFYTARRGCPAGDIE